MPTATELTQPYLRTYTRVLPVGPGVCEVCHGAPTTGFVRCWSCDQTVRQVTYPVTLVVPISLTELLGQLHHVLRSYKNDDYPASVREGFRLQVSALLTRFLHRHRQCISRTAGSDWDCITLVPSTSGRSGVHPLEQAIAMSQFLRDQYRSLLAIGPEPASHNQASDRAYTAISEASDLRVLLLDDTFTSGARAQSAASAISRAGGHVVAVVPVGRVIKPDFSPEARALIVRAREVPFTFDVCCLEAVDNLS